MAETKTDVKQAAFSVKEIARILSLSTSTVHNMLDRGEIESRRIGRRVVVPRSVLEEYVRQALGEELAV